MRVLMTADAVGGVWTYATDLATGLADAGVEVHMAVLGPQPGSGDRNNHTDPRFRLHRLPHATLDWLAPASDAVRAGAAEVGRLAEALDVDLVHLNSPALAAEVRFGRPVLGVCHSDVATWWAAVRGGPIDADLAWRAEVTGRGYAACDALVAPTRVFAEATARTYGVRAPSVVHNGRAGAAISFSPPREGEEGPSVFTAGRLWDEGKGMVVLDRAAARLSAPVHAAGPLRAPHGGEAKFEHLVPLGSLSPGAVAHRLRAAAVFCSPATYEPFGLAVLEAAQAARPLVLSDIPTFRELWDGAAAFTPPGDADALAAALERLLADAEERARLGEAARRRAGRFTVDAMTAGYLDLYRTLVRRKAAA